MRALKPLFNSPAQYPIVETDEIYPLYFLDNLASGRDHILSETLRFNQVLDAAKLHDGLSKLIQHGYWRKLGGRLRMRVRIRLGFLFVFERLITLIIQARRHSRAPCAKEIHTGASGNWI